MRDITIINEQARMQAIIDNNTLSLAQQLSTVLAHQAALETVLFGSRFSPFRVFFMVVLFGGSYLSKRIYEEQQDSLKKMKEFAKARAEEKSKEIVKPKLGVIKV